jgi:signal transduction histidine kinase
MQWQVWPSVLIYLGAALIGAAVALVARRHRHVAGATELAWLMVCVTLWALCDAVESAAGDMQVRIIASKVSHIGIQSVAPLFLLFVLHFTRREEWLTPRRIAALWIMPAITVFMVFTNEWHYLIWQSMEINQLPTGPDTFYRHGPFFWFAAGYNYILIAFSTVLLIQTLRANRDEYRKQSAVLIAATAVPWIGNVLYLSDFNPLPGLDWTSLAFIVTGVLLAYAIFVLRLFDLVPVARNVLIERMSDALLVTDSQNRVVDANPSARELLADFGDPVGQPLAAALGQETAMQLAAGSQEVHSVITLQNHRVHGLDALCTPLMDDSGRLNGRLIVLRDISERLQMEAELRRSEEHYRSFLAMVSHELRTPLMGILGMAEAMQANVYGPLNERQTRSLRVIEQSGRHLAAVISDMLDLSRIQSGTLELHYGVCLARELGLASIATVREEAERKQQDVEFQIDPPDLSVRVDVRRFEQVLVNLLGNAVKFTPASGKLGLQISEQAQDRTIVFTVWDNGIGIEPEVLAQLFRPFTQADERLSRTYGGAGLGLALVRRLVDLHGGSVSVQSTPGSGSRFTVTVPHFGGREELAIPSHTIVGEA